MGLDPDKEFASFKWAIEHIDDAVCEAPDPMAAIIWRNAKESSQFAQQILTKLLEKVTMNAKDAKAALEEQKSSQEAVERAISALEASLIKGKKA